MAKKVTPLSRFKETMHSRSKRRKELRKLKRKQKFDDAINEDESFITKRRRAR